MTDDHLEKVWKEARTLTLKERVDNLTKREFDTLLSALESMEDIYRELGGYSTELELLRRAVDKAAQLAPKTAEWDGPYSRWGLRAYAAELQTPAVNND